MFRALFQCVFVLAVSTQPGLAQSAPTSSNSCDDATKNPKFGVNESIAGRVASSKSLTPANYVMIFPSNSDTEKYVAYLAAAGKVTALPGEKPEDTSARVTRDMQEQAAKLPSMLASMRMAIADRRGSFACGGLAPGSYLIVLPVTVTRNDPNFGGRAMPQGGFYTARAKLPRLRAGSRGRLISTSSTFAAGP